MLKGTWRLERILGAACLLAGGVALGACTTPSADTTTDHPPLPFTATGTEPGWHLEMTGNRLVLQAAYGTVRVEAATPAPQRAGDARVYRPDAPGHRLTVAVRERYCSNAMSGMPYPFSVTVTLDGDTFDGCGGRPAALLIGAPWQVQALGGAPVDTEQPPTLQFTEGGGVSGFGGCNRYQGSYALTGEGLTFSPLASTRMSCGTADALELRFLRMLEQVRRFRLEGDATLVLETADGETLTARRP